VLRAGVALISKRIWYLLHVGWLHAIEEVQHACGVILNTLIM
jgi:hypothetical protein